MTKLLSNFSSNECGGGIVEYSLILALVAIAAVVALTSIGTKISTSFTNVAGKIQ